MISYHRVFVENLARNKLTRRPRRYKETSYNCQTSPSQSPQPQTRYDKQPLKTWYKYGKPGIKASISYQTACYKIYGSKLMARKYGYKIQNGRAQNTTPAAVNTILKLWPVILKRLFYFRMKKLAIFWSNSFSYKWKNKSYVRFPKTFLLMGLWNMPGSNLKPTP